MPSVTQRLLSPTMKLPLKQSAVIFHGLFGQATSMINLQKALMEDHEVSTPQLPYHGSTIDHTTFIQHMVQACESNPPSHIIGYSAGARLAALLAEQVKPERVTFIDLNPWGHRDIKDNGLFQILTRITATGVSSKQAALALLRPDEKSYRGYLSSIMDNSGVITKLDFQAIQAAKNFFCSPVTTCPEALQDCEINLIFSESSGYLKKPELLYLKNKFGDRFTSTTFVGGHASVLALNPETLTLLLDRSTVQRQESE